MGWVFKWGSADEGVRRLRPDGRARHVCGLRLTVLYVGRSRRSTRTHPTSTRPRARLLIGLTSTDLPSDQFSVLLLQKGVMMTNKPPKGLRAPPQLPRLHRIHSDPIKDMFADFLATRLCVGRQRGLLEPDKIAMASRLYRLPEQVCKSSARSWMDVYDHATLRHTSSPRPSSHPE